MTTYLTKNQQILTWACQLIAAIIMFQTLFFKFSGAEESVYIFTKIGIEPWGRIGTGITELIASVLLLLPSTAWMGALIGIGIMSGAIISHLFILGLSIKDDGGYLFMLAILTLLASLVVMYMKRGSIPYVKNLIQ